MRAGTRSPPRNGSAFWTRSAPSARRWRTRRTGGRGLTRLGTITALGSAWCPSLGTVIEPAGRAGTGVCFFLFFGCLFLPPLHRLVQHFLPNTAQLGPVSKQSHPAPERVWRGIIFFIAKVPLGLWGNLPNAATGVYRRHHTQASHFFRYSLWPICVRKLIFRYGGLRKVGDASGVFRGCFITPWNAPKSGYFLGFCAIPAPPAVVIPVAVLALRPLRRCGAAGHGALFAIVRREEAQFCMAGGPRGDIFFEHSTV